MTTQRSLAEIDNEPLRTHRAAVEVEGLSMRYGDKLILDELKFRIPTGQIVAILGPNGAGKSTIIEILEGFRRPSGGRVDVLGSEPFTAPEQWRSRVGVVLQSWRDHGKWRVRDFLAYVAAAHHSAGCINTWNIDELLNAVELTDCSGQKIGSLSGGQRRRVDVAAGVIARPELLFLDEPTTGFDPEVRRSFHHLIRTLASTTTIFWATHDLHEAEQMCDRIIILNHGSVIADGSPTELRRQMAADTTVTWRAQDGSPHTKKATDPMALIQELVTGLDTISELEVHRGTLEDAYLSIVSEVRPSLDSPEDRHPTRDEGAE